MSPGFTSSVMYISWVNPRLGTLTLTPTPDLGRQKDRTGRIILLFSKGETA